MKKRLKHFIFYFLITLLVLILVWRSLFLLNFNNNKTEFGVTFSTKQAENLDLNWKDVFTASLDNLKIRNYRLVAYWDEIEKVDGLYDFSDLDWQINEAQKRNAKIMIVIGRRVPRWPECHTPEWAYNLNKEEQNEKLLRYITITVNRYKNNPTIEMWQIENEHFLQAFGICPPKDKNQLLKEISLVKELDPKHPTVVTDSGELATWLRTRNLADYLGTSIYRTVYNPWIGYVNYGYLIPPSYYQLKAKLINKPVDKIFVSELQTEPWSPGDLRITPIFEQQKSMSLKQFESNIEFSKKVGFDKVYLWGVEWWYWMDTQGYPEYWNSARDLF